RLLLGRNLLLASARPLLQPRQRRIREVAGRLQLVDALESPDGLARARAQIAVNGSAIETEHAQLLLDGRALFACERWLLGLRRNNNGDLLLAGGLRGLRRVLGFDDRSGVAVGVGRLRGLDLGLRRLSDRHRPGDGDRAAGRLAVAALGEYRTGEAAR